MKIPRWKASYSVGNDRIDHQHRYFLSLIEHFQNSIEADSSPEFIHNLFEEVTLYAKFHFCSEENMMRIHKFPDLEYHKELHNQLIRDLVGKITHIGMKKIGIEEIVLFLTDWFIHHTITEDMLFHDYVKANHP